ncbi:homocysteine S-methyltransferase, partial [Clavibacter michiganensis subsp. michiganensis]
MTRPLPLPDRPLVLDGGLGTLLEARGHDLSDPLWSARVLADEPDAVRAAHAEFFRAGADVAITASYQVGFEAFAARGLGAADTEALLRASVRLAAEARDEVAREDAAGAGRDRWIAASVGPYGATLGDGSEY